MKHSFFANLQGSIRKLLIVVALITLSWLLLDGEELQKHLGSSGRISLFLLTCGALFIVCLRWWYQRQPPRINVFYNGTGEQERQAHFDAVARNMAALLQFEFFRINELLYIPESIAVQHPAYEKNQIPRSPVFFKSTFSPSETKGSGPMLETFQGVGPLSLGPVKLPLGGIFYFMAKIVQGAGVTGSIQKYGEHLAVIAALNGRKWTISSEILTPEERSEERLIQELSRRLAYKMFADLNGYPSWRSFREVVQGLEQYQRFLRSGRKNMLSLQKAQLHFEHACVIDSQFAMAWYNLGIVYEAQNATTAALEAYKIAKQLKSDYSEAHISLGKIYGLSGETKMAVQAYELGISHAEKIGKKVPAARIELGRWLVELAALEETPAASINYYKRAVSQLRIADKVYKKLAQRVRKPEFLLQQQGFQHGREQTLKELSEAYQRLYEVLHPSNQQNSHLRRRRLLGFLSFSRLQRIDRTLEKALLKRLRLNPNSSQTYADLIGYYASRNHYEKIEHYIALAEKINPEDNIVAFSISETFLNHAAEDVLELISNWKEKPETYTEQWGEERLKTTLALLEFARTYYENVVNQVAKNSEDSLDSFDREDMVRALNGLANAFGAIAILSILIPEPFMEEGETKEDFNVRSLSRINYARMLLSKALTLYPLDRATYDNLIGMYDIEKGLLDILIADESEREKLSREIDVCCDDIECVLEEMSDDTLPLVEEVEDGTESQIYLWCVGWIHIHYAKLEEGLAFLEKALQADLFYEAYLVNYEIGEVYQKLKLWDKAISYYSNVVKTDWNYWKSRMGLAESLVEKAAEAVSSTLSIREDDSQETSLDESEEDIITDRQHLRDQAVLAYQEAVDAAANDPYRRATTFAGLAELSRTQGRFNIAMQYCQEAMNLVAGYQYPYSVMASIYSDLKDYDKEIEYWLKMKALSPYQEIFHCYDGLGYAYFCKSMATSDRKEAKLWMERAADQYRQAIGLLEWEAGSEQVGVYLNLGKSLVELKKYKEAEAAYLTALQMQTETPDIFETHLYLAYVYVKQLFFTDAYIQYQKASTICEQQMRQAKKSDASVDLVKYVRGLAQAYNDQAYYLHAELDVKLDEGLKLVNRAIEIVDDFYADEDQKRLDKGAYLDTRGWVYYKMGNHEMACLDLEKAIELTMGTAEEHGHLALIYEKKAEESSTESEQKEWKEKARSQWKLAIDQEQDGKWQKEWEEYQIFNADI